MKTKSTNFSEDRQNAPVHSTCELKEDCNCTLTGERLDKFLRDAACTDQPSGPGAKERPQFIPTHNELIQLVKYWTKKENWCGLFLLFVWPSRRRVALVPFGK